MTHRREQTTPETAAAGTAIASQDVKRVRVPSTGLLRRLSYNIGRLRSVRGLSQGELGKASGISKGHISNLEHERLNASLATLEALTVGFDCDVLDLFQRIPPQAQPLQDDAV